LIDRAGGGGWRWRAQLQRFARAAHGRVVGVDAGDPAAAAPSSEARPRPVICYTVDVLKELAAGVYDGLRGAIYLAARPRLWKWVFAPAVVAAVILIVAIGWILGLLSAPIAALAAYLPGAWADNVLRLLAGVVLAVLSVTIFISLAALIAAPFNEMLSEAIEERETGVPSPKFRVLRFLGDVALGIAHAARRVSVYVVIMLGLLVLGVAVPVVGTLVAAALGGIATARFASYDAYDAVWARRRLRYRDKVGYLRAHRWRTLGLGAVVACVLIVPGLNVLGLSIGATAATLRSLAERADRDERAATAKTA
jgi:CysZ protein